MSPRLRFRLAVATAVLVAYGLLGFLLLPWMAKRELPRIIEEGIHHHAAIGDLQFNPFTLTLRARDFALTDGRGRKVLGFAEAEADLEWRSLARAAWIFSEIRLVQPALHADIGKDGRLNLAALAPAQDSGGAARPTNASRLPRFAIGRLALENGRIAFEDQREDFRDSLEKLSFELTALTTLDDEKGPHALAGQTPGGASLRWSGEISLEPLAATGTLSVSNLALAELMPYVDDVARVNIASGRAETRLPYRFTLPGGKPLLTLHDSSLQIRDLEVQELASGAGRAKPPIAKLGQLLIEGADVDFSTRHASIRTLHLDDAAVTATRNARGELDLARLLASKPDAQASVANSKQERKQETQAWQLDIAAASFAKLAATYADATAKTPLALVAQDFSGKARLHIEAGAQDALVRVEAGEFTLAQLSAAPASQTGQVPIGLASVVITGARFDSGERLLDIDAVRVGSLTATATLLDGRVSLLDLAPVSSGEKTGKPYATTIKTAELGESGIHVTDNASGASLALAKLTAKLSGVSSDAKKPLTFDAGAEVASGGRITLRGRMNPAQGTLAAKFEATAVALAPLQPFLERYASVKLTSGDATLSGSLNANRGDAKTAEPKSFSFLGKAALSNVALDDTTGVRLLGWKSLATDSLRLSFSPNRLDIDELRWSEPAGRLAIATDRTSNLTRAFAKKNANPPDVAAGSAKPGPAGNLAGSTTETAAGSARENPPPSDGDDAFAVAIRRVRVADGALEFSDDSLSPRYVAKIYALAGTANGLASDRSTRSQFDFEGRLDEFGYAHLSGSVNPFQPRERSSFRIQLQNVDLASTSPYSMRFAGYRIASGRMTLDLNYRVRSNTLEGDNKITLEQLTLGERVDSPDAFKLPLSLAISLLKDENGTIAMELPVTGNLDDPQFSIAPIVWKAVENFLLRIVAAPFRAIAHLLGGNAGEEAGAIVFDPGASRLQPPEQEKIVHIAALLAKRREFRLLIPAHYDSEADVLALKRADLGRDVARRAGFSVADDESPGPLNLDDRPTRSALRALFAQKFSSAELDKLKAEAELKSRAANLPAPSVVDRVRNLATGEPNVGDAREFYATLTRRLRDAQVLPPNALAELAQKRTAAIETALKAAGADPARIEKTAGSPSADKDAKQVKLQLSLAVH